MEPLPTITRRVIFDIHTALRRNWWNSCLSFTQQHSIIWQNPGQNPGKKEGCCFKIPLPETSRYISPRRSASGSHLDGKRHHTCRQEKLTYESTTKISPLPKELVGLERAGTTETWTLREFIYILLAGGSRHLPTSLFNPYAMKKRKFKAGKEKLCNFLAFRLRAFVKSQLPLNAAMSFPDECTLFLHRSIRVWWLSCFSSQNVRDQILS